MSNNWIKVAGLVGFSAVGIGAIGAHAVIHSSDAMRDTFKTGSLYHLVHSCILAVSASTLVGRKRNIVCGLFTGGIVLFSGALYTIALMDQKQPFNKVAPVGGLMLMAGWAAFGIL